APVIKTLFIVVSFGSARGRWRHVIKTGHGYDAAIREKTPSSDYSEAWSRAWASLSPLAASLPLACAAVRDDGLLPAPMRVTFVVALLIATGLIVLDPCRNAEEPDHPRGRCFSAEPAAACAHHEDPGDLPFHGHAHDTRPARPNHAARSA